MDFLRRLLFGLRRKPKLTCPRTIWLAGTRELAKRTSGYRESGAFLLGTVTQRNRRIEKFLFYDDIDPACFSRGIVEFDGRKLGRVWAVCRQLGLTVVADVHVHPGHYSQSESDQQNPIIAEIGHFALILPSYARRPSLPGKIGIFEYLGSRRWRDHSARGKRVMEVIP